MVIDIYEHDGQLVTTSHSLAQNLGVKHGEVVRAIWAVCDAEDGDPLIRKEFRTVPYDAYLKEYELTKRGVCAVLATFKGDYPKELMRSYLRHFDHLLGVN